MASLESFNTFEGGMNGDLSNLFQQKNTYKEAFNVRPITELGSTTQSLVNIKGNKFRLNIPNTLPVYRIQVKENATGSSTTTITIVGNSGSPITITSSTIGYDLYNNLTTISGFNTTFKAAYDDNYVVIWSEIQDPLVQLSSTADIDFVTQNSSAYYVEPQINLEPIGSTFIRDDIFIFTTNNNSLNPISTGQIWKLQYNKINDSNTLTLIYNNYINFSTQYGISSTATLGRYENDNIQRVYWTDNYNKLRQANIANPNLMALTPNLLSVFPTVDEFVPTLQEVSSSGGSVKTGMYQFSYQLVKANGQVTFWSPLSNLIGIYSDHSDADFTNGNNWYNYIGEPSNTATNKSITLLINNLDTNYDFINLAVVKRYSSNDPGTVEIFSSNEPIPLDGSLEFTYTQEEDVTDLTLEELLQNAFGFTHCKTIATKDNRLFVGNVRDQQDDINYDSRSYQYPSGSTNTDLTNTGITTTYSSVNLNTPFYLPETSDTINANFDIQKYQPGTVIPGGVGPNISYTFGTHVLKVDEIADANFNTSPGDSPWRHCNQFYDYVNGIDTIGINFGIEDENYPFHYINDSLKSTYKSTLLKGYRHNEIYRFGIQFYDKEGRPYFVKWISDIKFPDYNDFNPNPGYIDNNIASPYTDFRPVFSADPGGGLRGYMNILYVTFTVNIPNDIKDLISGFEIVRVERPYKDQTVVASGILYQTRSDGAANLYLPNTGRASAITANSNTLTTANAALNIDDDTRTNVGGASAYDFTFEYFDWNCQQGIPDFDSTSDTLYIKGKIGTTATSAVGFTTCSPGTDAGNGYYYAKFYNWDTYYNDSFPLLDLRYLGRNDQYTSPLNSGWGYTNQDHTVSGPLIRTEGIPTFYVITEQPLLYFGTYGCNSTNQLKLFFEYRKSRPNQYGGRSYSSRANNEYISCQGYIPVTDVNVVNFSSISFKTFGGDCFYGIHQNQKGLKNSGNAAADRESYIHYKPHIGSYNVELRAGIYFDFNAGSVVSECNFSSENFIYETTYSLENNIRKFFPKPVIFNQTDIWDNRIYYSQIKINGETIDNWSRFRIADYYDVEGSYGPINSLVSLQDKMYYVQDNGFGLLYINPIALAKTANGIPLTLATGEVIQRHDYVSIDCGTRHQWSVYSSPNSIVFIDSIRKKLYRYNGSLESTSDSSGQRGYLGRVLHDDILITDKPILRRGISSFYDNYNSEFIFTFQNTYGQTTEYNTLVFNEITGKFTSYYSFTPKCFITNHQEYYTTDPSNSNKLYRHNDGNYGEFYGIKYDSSIKLVSNENSNYTKVFNNLVWLTESIQESSNYDQYDNINIFNDTFNEFRMYNDYQNTDWITLNTANKNPRRVERSWNLQVPRNKVLYSTSSPNIFTDLGTKSYGERIRDKYSIIDLVYNNTNNYRFSISLLKTQYLISDR